MFGIAQGKYGVKTVCATMPKAGEPQVDFNPSISAVMIVATRRRLNPGCSDMSRARLW